MQLKRSEGVESEKNDRGLETRPKQLTIPKQPSVETQCAGFIDSVNCLDLLSIPITFPFICSDWKVEHYPNVSTVKAILSDWKPLEMNCAGGGSKGRGGHVKDCPPPSGVGVERLVLRKP